MGVLLHVSDWNLEDKWYELSEESLKEFRTRVLKDGVRLAWDWLLAEKKAGRAVRCDESTNHTLDEFFFDYTNPVESVEEWEFG